MSVAISLENLGRFRINIFSQQQRCGMVIRVITTEIPDFDKMNLPPILRRQWLDGDWNAFEGQFFDWQATKSEGAWHVADCGVTA